jgi:tetratricopeptide (TPR) repeat protein
MIDANSLFSRAQQAFAAGRCDAARQDLEAVLRAVGEEAAVLHLLALTEKKAGRGEAAAAAFARAQARAPQDAAIAGNHANLLADMGRDADALAQYDRALALQPGFRDARFNRALLLARIGRQDEALAELDALAAHGPAEARIHSARAGLLMALERVDEAADAFDAALRIEPARLTALHGRARVAMERGEPGASDLFARALQLRPGDSELVMGLVQALEAEGDPLGLQLLKETVAARPEWVDGHALLARMRSEAGEGAAFADHYRAALAARPADRALHLSYWRTLAQADRHAEALTALRAAKDALGAPADLCLMEAALAGEAGAPAQGLAILDSADLPSTPELAFTRGRLALHAGDPAQAAAALEPVVAADPGAINAWAHLDLAWRLLGDPRHGWLSGQDGLFGPRDLGLGGEELTLLAELLRALHRTRAHPIGQSLRGGTQTRGRLFWRREPALARLHAAILEAVEAYRAALPPADPRHPLLRHRDRPLGLAGSWSVRLTDAGFHINHIHPEGVLSSACYIGLPASLGDCESRAGWLEIGRPPAELGLTLEPLAAIKPRPGRLALFPSYLFHGTRPFAHGERLTVAFDLVPA